MQAQNTERLLLLSYANAACCQLRSHLESVALNFDNMLLHSLADMQQLCKSPGSTTILLLMHCNPQRLDRQLLVIQHNLFGNTQAAQRWHKRHLQITCMH